jgi:putative isomerase
LYDYYTYYNKTHKLEQYDLQTNTLFIIDAKAWLQLTKYSTLNLKQQINTVNCYIDSIEPQIEKYLFDESRDIYNNRFVHPNASESLYNLHISPSIFYPLGFGLPSISLAEYLVTRYLTNTSEFCVNINCKSNIAPLPSITQSDITYKDQNYWRGRFWGPLLYITASALNNEKYESSIIIQDAIKVLINQANKVWQYEYFLYGHIHENYNAMNSLGCDNNYHGSDSYYTWGAVSAFLPLLYNSSYP